MVDWMNFWNQTFHIDAGYLIYPAVLVFNGIISAVLKEPTYYMLTNYRDSKCTLIDFL